MPPGAFVIAGTLVDEAFGSPVIVEAELGPDAEAGDTDDTADEAGELLDETDGESALAKIAPLFAILMAFSVNVSRTL